MLEKYTIAKKENTDFNVYRCGFEDCSPGYSWGPGVRDHYIIHYVLSGEGTFTMNGKSHVVKKGHGFLICPNYIVGYKADLLHPWTYSWVGFNGLKAGAVLAEAGLSADSPIFEFEEGMVLYKSLNDLIMAARQEYASELMMTGYLYVFLSLLITNYETKQNSGSYKTGGDHYVSNAIDYISKNYGTGLRIQDLSSFLRLDRSYFSTLFKKHVGMSPQAFLIRFRMDKAAELLKNRSLDVGDVARSVGYEDPLLFSRMFKNIRGVSPNAFRKQNQLEIS